MSNNVVILPSTLYYIILYYVMILQERSKESHEIRSTNSIPWRTWKQRGSYKDKEYGRSNLGQDSWSLCTFPPVNRARGSNKSLTLHYITLFTRTHNCTSHHSHTRVIQLRSINHERLLFIIPFRCYCCFNDDDGYRNDLEIVL